MYSKRVEPILLTVVLLCLLAAVGAAQSPSVEPQAKLATTPPASAYFPLWDADIWYYTGQQLISDELPPPPYAIKLSSLTEGGGEYYSYEYTNEVLGTENIGGVETLLWCPGNDRPIMALASQSDGVYCYKVDDQILSPPQRLLKFPFTVGASWILGDINVEAIKFTVQAINDTVEVEAGTFTNCVRLKLNFYSSEDVSGAIRTLAAPLSPETDLIWLAPFVGIVKEEYYENDVQTGWSELTSFDIYIPDETPPPTPVVVDDGAISYGNSLHAKWTCEDPESGIAGYRVAISTTPDESGILVLPDESTAEFEIEVVNEGTSPGLPLVEGETYYALVKARNNAGLESDWGVSDGIQVTLTPPNQDLVPLQVGNHWYYALWDQWENESVGQIDVNKSSTMSGVTVYDVELDLGEPEPELLTLGRTAAGVLIYKKDGETVSPPEMFLKLPPEVGSSWETPDEESGTVTHTIMSVDEVVETPAGVFENCVQVQETYSDWPDEIQYFWFAPGVGIVKNEYYSGETLSHSMELTGWHVFAGPPDTTAPTKPTVTVASSVIYGTTVSATWSSSDPQSGIYEYQAAVSTTTNDSGIIGAWESFGADTEGSLEDLPLQQGPTYYVIAKAMSGAGLWSQVGASRSFKIEKAIGSIEITPSPATVKAGGKQQFTATVKDEDDLSMTGKKIVWSCLLEPTLGKISSRGLFTAGCTTGSYPQCITATVAGSDVVGYADVEIVPGDPWKVLVEPDLPTPTTVTLDCAETYEFTAKVIDRCGNEIEDAEITWSVKNANVGEIDLVTGVFTAGPNPGRHGNAIIATCGVKKGRATVIVAAPPPVRVEVTPNPISIEVGKSQRFTAVGYDALERPISKLKFQWSVSEEALGAISSAGVFRAAKAPGSGEVQAQALIDGEPAGDIGASDVEVIPGAPSKVLVFDPAVTLAAGQPFQFEAQLVDRYGNPVDMDVTWSWSCANPNAGTFDPETLGLFTAGATPGSYGSCVVATATYAGGTKTKSGRARVTVTSGT